MPSDVKIALFFLGDINYDARCLNMLRTLASASYKIDVFHNSPKTNKKENIQKININNWQTKHDSGWLRFYEWFAQIKKIKLEKYQTIIAADLYSLVGLNNQNKKTKIIYDVRDFFNEISALNKKPFKKMIWTLLEKQQIKQVHTIFSTSKADEMFLKKKFSSYKTLKYQTVYNFSHSNKIKKTDYLRTRFPINKNQHVLIYQGIIEKGRGLEIMLDCIQNNITLCAVIVGGGPDENYYKEKIKLLKLSSRWFFHEKVKYKNLLSITSSADLGCALIEPVCINNYYALPNKIFEYAACGLPVISSNLPGMSPYIKKYKLGESVNVSNKKKLYQKIHSLIKRKDMFSQKKQKNHLSWKSQEKIFLENFT